MRERVKPETDVTIENVAYTSTTTNCARRYIVSKLMRGFASVMRFQGTLIRLVIASRKVKGERKRWKSGER